MTYWFYILDGKPEGPLSEEDVKHVFDSGALPMTTSVWREGMSDWALASTIECFGSDQSKRSESSSTVLDRLHNVSYGKVSETLKAAPQLRSEKQTSLRTADVTPKRLSSASADAPASKSTWANEFRTVGIVVVMAAVFLAAALGVHYLHVSHFLQRSSTVGSKARQSLVATDGGSVQVNSSGVPPPYSKTGIVGDNGEPSAEKPAGNEVSFSATLADSALMDAGFTRSGSTVTGETTNWTFRHNTGVVVSYCVNSTGLVSARKCAHPLRGSDWWQDEIFLAADVAAFTALFGAHVSAAEAIDVGTWHMEAIAGNQLSEDDRLVIRERQYKNWDLCSRWECIVNEGNPVNMIEEFILTAHGHNVILPSALALASAVAQAQFLYTTNNGAITITGYTGSGGAVAIPSTINGLPVTSIGDGAFRGTCLTSVTIPTSVTSLGEWTFGDCTNLTSVRIGNGVITVGRGAFQGCSSLTRVTIPNSVTSLGEWTFQGCSSLTSVSIGNGVTHIGNAVFFGCSSLTNVTIGNRVRSIGDMAFLGCKSLASVTLPNSVTDIGGLAFGGCTSLTSLTIPNSVTSIDYRAFDGCTSLPGMFRVRR